MSWQPGRLGAATVLLRRGIALALDVQRAASLAGAVAAACAGQHLLGAILTPDWNAAGLAKPRQPRRGVAIRPRCCACIDGDTFEARVHLWPGLDITTRVRLRGIDAPEMKARCGEERARPRPRATRLRAMLDQGEVGIFDVTLDKYGGRVVADASTRSDAGCLGGAARRRARPPLWRRPPRGLVLECSRRESPAFRGFQRLQVNAASRSPACRR